MIEDGKYAKQPPGQGYFSLDGLNLIIRIPLGYSNHSGILLVNIKDSNITNLLSSPAASRSITILDASGGMVASNDQTFYINNYLTAINNARINDITSDKGYFTISSNAKKIGVTFIKSNYNNWNYIYLMDIGDFEFRCVTSGLDYFYDQLYGIDSGHRNIPYWYKKNVSAG